MSKDPLDPLIVSAISSVLSNAVNNLTPNANKLEHDTMITLQYLDGTDLHANDLDNSK